MFIRSALIWLDDNLEKTLVLFSYVTMTSIIVLAVAGRFLFSIQLSWSGSVPIYLFLWIVWIGCSYNVKKRSHLSFTELRSRMTYGWQFACICADSIMWMLFGVVIAYYSAEQALLAYANFSVVPGTLGMMQWWFYCVIPMAWVVTIFRVIQNWAQDAVRFKRGEPFPIESQAV